MRTAPSLRLAALVTAALTLLFCAGFGLVFRPRYGTGDDPSMALIAAGLHGNPPSELTVFSNVLVGFLLKTLYLQVGSVNWHGVALYCVLTLALGGMFLAVLWRGPTLRRILCCLPIATIALPYWMSLQFTTVTVWAAWSAAWLFVSARAAPPRIARALLATGIMLLVAAALIRVHAAVLALVIMAPWLMDVIRPIPPRPVQRALLAALAIAGVATIGDALYYQSRADWRAWLVYNRARAELHDRPQFRKLTWDIRQRIAGAGWSSVDTSLFSQWIFFDDEIYDAERLRAVAGAVADQLPPLATAWDTLKERLQRQGAVRRIGLPVLLCLALGWRRGSYLVRTSATGALLLPLALWLLHSYKLDDRWLRPMIDVIPIASMMWLAVPPAGPRRGERWQRAIGVAVLLLYAGDLWRPMRYHLLVSERNVRAGTHLQGALERLTTYAQVGAQRGEPVVFVTLGRSIQPQWLHPLQSIAILRDAPILRFGWLTHSPHYRLILERHGMRDVYADLVQRRDLLLVCAPETMRLFVAFLRERRKRQVEADVVPDFADFQELLGVSVYRLRDAKTPPVGTGKRSLPSTKRMNGVDDRPLIRRGEIVVERQAQ